MENTEEHCEMIWEIWKKSKLKKRYGNYGRKVSWIVKWFGKYGRKASGIMIRYGQYGRKVNWIVETFGKFRRKLWNDMENMEERQVE